MNSHPADSLLAASPLQAIFRRRAAARLTVLAYHEVPAVHAATFESQLDHLVDAWRPVSLDAVLEHLDGGSALPDHAVLVTFDDGDRSLLEVAAPRLRSRGVPAVGFVVTGLLGGDRPPWWREVEDLTAAAGGSPAVARRRVAQWKRLPDDGRRRAMEALRETARRAGRAPRPRPQLQADELPALANAGIEIGSHTHTHPCLDRCPVPVVKEEIGLAHRRLTELLGRPPRAFAYPNGDHSDTAEAELADLGYAAAFLFDHRVSPLPPARRLAISRVRVNAWTPPARFRILVSGLHPWLHHLRGRR